jgi:hypothetical protein
MGNQDPVRNSSQPRPVGTGWESLRLRVENGQTLDNLSDIQSELGSLNKLFVIICVAAIQQRLLID